MSAIFDPIRFAASLKEASVKPVQADAEAQALHQAMSHLATKEDLHVAIEGLQKDIDIKLAPIKTDILLMKWMLGFIFTGVAALILKAFF